MKWKSSRQFVSPTPTLHWSFMSCCNHLLDFLNKRFENFSVHQLRTSHSQQLSPKVVVRKAMAHIVEESANCMVLQSSHVFFVTSWAKPLLLEIIARTKQFLQEGICQHTVSKADQQEAEMFSLQPTMFPRRRLCYPSTFLWSNRLLCNQDRG